MLSRGKNKMLDFTEEERAILKKYFKNLDVDKSGEIGMNELQNPFISLGIVDNIG